jgi:outer membrane protein OmpA-like peptidoglycan-associated protein
LDSADRCPDEAEDMDGFEDADGCPDVDDDHDGVLDSVDTCPRAAGPLGTGGCPDGDGDGVTDTKDTCPAVAGPAATGGCPDRDADGVADAVDACPDLPVEPERLGTGDGCPSVRVDAAAGKVSFEGTVTFEPGTARLTAEAGPLLDKIAVVLVAHPELKRLEVGGHTDSDGDTRSNQRLSRDRAQSVVDYLVHKGVSPSRLVARGYGETVPLDTNLTMKGRARNRRVEITILP